MEYYWLKCNVIDFRWMVSTSDEGGKQLVRVRETPVAHLWNPVEVEWTPETTDLDIGDFPRLTAVVLCFSKKGLDALHNMLTENGELLPLSGLNNEYTGYHVLTLANLDWEKSDLVGDREHLSKIRQPVLHKESIPSGDIFGIEESIVDTFVSNRFKKIVEDHNLLGFEFIPIDLS